MRLTARRHSDCPDYYTQFITDVYHFLYHIIVMLPLNFQLNHFVLKIDSPFLCWRLKVCSIKSVRRKSESMNRRYGAPAALMPHVRPYSLAPVRVAWARNNCWPSSVRLTHSDAYVLKWQLSVPPALWPAMRVRQVRGPQPLVRLGPSSATYEQPLWQLRPRMRFNYAVFIDLTQFQNRLVLLSFCVTFVFFFSLFFCLFSCFWMAISW